MAARWSVSPFGMLWPAMDAAFRPDDRLQRPNRVLRLILDPGHGAAVARRSVLLPSAMGEVPALMGSAPPTTPPSTGTGVVVCIMG
jgi:hypothetical protein